MPFEQHLINMPDAKHFDTSLKYQERVVQNKCINLIINGTLHERHGASNYRAFDSLLTSLFNLTPKKTSKLRITGHLMGGNPPFSADS